MTQRKIESILWRRVQKPTEQFFFQFRKLKAFILYFVTFHWWHYQHKGTLKYPLYAYFMWFLKACDMWDSSTFRDLSPIFLNSSTAQTLWWDRNKKICLNWKRETADDYVRFIFEQRIEKNSDKPALECFAQKEHRKLTLISGDASYDIKKRKTWGDLCLFPQPESSK